MGTPKIIGIETEYGIAGGPEADPTLASSLIVNAYAQHGQSGVTWDFIDESPDHDARGYFHDGAFAPIIETHLANTVLTNAARLYVDHAHPEYSSPECRTPREAVLYDQAGEEIMRRAQMVANQTLDDEHAIRLYKNNSDGKGNSYGTHENYLLSRDVDFADVVRAMVPHFVSRSVITGAGKVGFETDAARGATFQISARAEFFEEIVGLETTLKRPIINTRDEPHSDPDRFRRLHVINGDANMSPRATWVKLGATALLLLVLEERGSGVFPPPPRRPVAAIRAFGADPHLRATVEAEGGQRVSALDYQEALFILVDSHVRAHGAPEVADDREVRELLAEWSALLEGVRSNPDDVADRVDWIAKWRVIQGYQERYGLPETDARLRAIDLQYHDLRPEKSLAARVGLAPLWAPANIQDAVFEAPRSTRAYFRGECVRRFPEELVSANWDSLVFDVGSGPLRRVPMMDPTRGTEALTGALFANEPTAASLLDSLNG
jgi:proteasome accessory factor A